MTTLYNYGIDEMANWTTNTFEFLLLKGSGYTPDKDRDLCHAPQHGGRRHRGTARQGQDHPEIRAVQPTLRVGVPPHEKLELVEDVLSDPVRPAVEMSQGHPHP